MRRFHSYSKALSRIRGGTPMRRLNWPDQSQYLYLHLTSGKVYLHNSTLDIRYKLTSADEHSNDWIIYTEERNESK